MRVCIIGESPRIPSGFGKQCGLLAKALVDNGHFITIFVRTGGGASTIEGVDEWIIDHNNTEALDEAVFRLEPDCVIVFSHIFTISSCMLMLSAPANCPVYVWLPWEADTLPLGADSLFYNMLPYSLVHLSEFAVDLWKDKLSAKTVIPHGYDPIFRKLDVSRHDLRRKWSERLRYPLFDDSIVILNVDRNIQHKRWDATYDCIRRLNKELDGKVQLIAHTKINGENVPEGSIKGFDLKELEKLYGIENKVCYTDFDWHRGFSTEDLCELYNLVDMRISTSSGEGFGVPTIEAAACGCPQVINQNQVASELLKNSGAYVESAMLDLDRKSLWRVPNVNEMTYRIIHFIQDEIDRKIVTEENKNFVEDTFNWDKIGRQWSDYISEERDVNFWGQHRYGFKGDYLYRLMCKELTETLKDFDVKNVLEIGSFNGILLEYLMSRGIRVEGMEPDKENSQHACGSRAKLYTAYTSYLDDWEEAEAIVLTDQFPLIYAEHDTEGIDECISRLQNYKWIFIRNHSVYKWGLPKRKIDIESKLLDAGLTRRFDLEGIVKDQKKRTTFDHEVWQSKKDTSMMVMGLLAD